MRTSVTLRPRRQAARLAGFVALFCVGTTSLLAQVAPAAARPQRAEDVIPPPVPEAENAAALYLEAEAVLEAEDVWNSNLASLAAEVYTGVFSPAGRRSFVAWVESLRIPSEGNRQATVGEMYDEFTRRLESPAVIKAMTLVAQATERPQCRFNIDYSKGAETLLPHLAKLRTLARFLGAAGGVACERGDGETAWECVLWQLQLADAPRTEPLLISQLVRLAIGTIACAGAHQAAEQFAPAAEIRAVLDQRLAGLDDPQPWVMAIDGERLLFSEWVCNQPLTKIQELLNSGGTTPTPALNAEQVAAGRVICSRATARLAELAAKPYHEVRSELAAFPAPGDGTNPLARALLPALGNYCRKTAEFEAVVRVTRIGLRLKHHRAAQGTYPASLTAVSLSDIPVAKQQDPFTGRTLCYRPDGDGFALYSVGPDGRDDGGTPRTGEAKAGHDLVWRTAK